MESKKLINPLWNVIKTEWFYLGKRRKNFLFYMFLFVIAGIFGLLTPLIIGFIFNSIQEGITSEAELRKLIWMISWLLWIKIFLWIFHGSARIMESLTGFFVHRNYTNEKVKKVLELSVKWHKDNHSGDTIDKVNRGREALASFSQYKTFSIFYGVINIFGALFILFFVDKLIASFAFVFSSLILFIIMRLDRRLTEYYKELNKFSNKLSSSIFDYLSNILTVITLRLKKTVSLEIDNRLMASYPTHKKAIFFSEIKWSLASIAITFMIVLALSYRAYSDYHTTGIILIGTLYILYGYLQRVGETFFRFASLYGEIINYDARIQGAYPIDNAFDEIKEKIKGNLPSNWKNIELKNIDFTYDIGGKKQHLKKIDIKFKRGQKIALVGESGSGKSTIFSLMRGLYLPDKGEIYYNGLKLKNGIDKLKQQVTLVPQDPEIFNNTIRYNLTMGVSVKKEELDKAINMARFRKVVDRLEKGLDTNVLEKGVSLSGGEKQRLALARGLLAARQSDIVLLDEPTSSVDSLNEMKIHESIFEEFKDKTIISSIHRLNLLNKFDYIYMFEKGKIVAEGTLKDIQKTPRFKHIWKKYGVKKV